MGNCVDFAAIKRSVGLALVLGRYHVRFPPLAPVQGAAPAILIATTAA